MSRRLVFFPLAIAVIAFLLFLRTAGAEHVRAVQIVDLIAIGVCLGLALARMGLPSGAKSQT
jgi:prolipoprotein diacylglyceryltransferase